MTLGENIRRLRKERGLSQMELRKLAGVSQQAISQIETGLRHPYSSTLAKLAEALGVSVADFFEESTPKGPPPPPKTPRTDEADKTFDRELHAVEDLGHARALRDELEREWAALTRYERALQEAKAPPADVLLARKKKLEARDRLLAATMVYSELMLERSAPAGSYREIVAGMKDTQRSLFDETSGHVESEAS